MQPAITESAPRAFWLRSEFDDATADKQRRLHAALALARLGDVETAFLIRAIENAVPEECDNIIAAIEGESVTELVSDGIAAAEGKSNWSFKARLAIAPLYQGDAASAVEMCRQRNDPIQRTLFIEEFSTWHTDLDRLVEAVVPVADPDFRSAMCLALGSVPAVKLSTSDREGWEPVLRDWYLEPDAATHGAADWAFRQWEQELPVVSDASLPSGDAEWKVNSNEMTMVRIAPGSFVRTDSYRDLDRFSHQAHQELVHQNVQLSRGFLISDREVTRGQFLTFMNDPDVPDGAKPVNWVTPQRLTPTAEHPVQKIAWFHALMYCNWLSKREGFTLCYQGTYQRWGTINDADGYRLPTEAEFEYVCRAGTDTTYCFGDDDALLNRYAVVGTTKPSVSGSRLPNH